MGFAPLVFCLSSLQLRWYHSRLGYLGSLGHLSSKWEPGHPSSQWELGHLGRNSKAQTATMATMAPMVGVMVGLAKWRPLQWQQSHQPRWHAQSQQTISHQQ